MDPQRLAKLQSFYKQQGFIETEHPVDQLLREALARLG